MIELKMDEQNTKLRQYDVVFTPEQVAQVKVLACYQNLEQIAEYFDISVDTLARIRKRQPEVQEAYKAGKHDMAEKINNKLKEKAADGDMQAMRIYYQYVLRYFDKESRLIHDDRLRTLDFSTPEKRTDGLHLIAQIIAESGSATIDDLFTIFKLVSSAAIFEALQIEQPELLKDATMEDFALLRDTYAEIRRRVKERLEAEQKNLAL
jgi:hypothetical protein